MKSIDSKFYRNIFLFFVVNLIILSSLSIYIKHVLYSTDCQSRFRNLLPSDINLERVSVGLWLKLCDREKIFIGSSESTGELSIPDLLRARGQHFSQFTGAHRGIKTYGFFTSLALNQTIVKNSRFLVLLNPIYFTEGPAKTAPSMAYRTAITNTYFNQVVGAEIAKPKPIIDRPWVALKNTFDELFFIFNNNQIKQILVNEDDKLNMALKKFKSGNEYNLQLNLLKNFEKNNFNSKISFNISPTKELFTRVIENKNQLKQCVVLLPMNRRFFSAQNKDYVRQIENLYQEIRNRILPEEIIDLTFLDSTDYLFTDIMHFTQVGSILITQNIVESKCYNEQWL